MNIQPIGLSKNEVIEKRHQFGFNELPTDKSDGVFKIIWTILTEPMIGLLIIGAVIYLLLGDHGEALLMIFSVLVIISIELFQEKRSKKSLEALRNLANPKTKVIRDGVQLLIPSREVVPGDILVLIEGDRISADGKIISATNLQVDESLLTGESVPVSKRQYDATDKQNKPGGNNTPWVFSGSLIVKGHGFAKVTSIGINTEVGKIGQTLNSFETEKTQLQKETSVFIKKIAIFGISACILLIFVYGITKGDWLKAILAGITMAMGALPEEFPIVLTLFLIMGAWRLAQKNVLARRAATIETLGSTTVLCVDKTGTLTKNQMTIDQIFVDNKLYNLPALVINKSIEKIINYGTLACQINSFDPMEKAFFDCASKYKITNPQNHLNLVREYPLETKSLSVVHVWQKNKKYIVAAKGSPETILDLCHLNKSEKSKLEKQFKAMAEEGFRVLGVAKCENHTKKLPLDRHHFKFDFLGFIGLIDPIRERVSHSIKECHEAGIRVIIITGDYPATAQNIAQKIGIDTSNGVMTGSELEKINYDQLVQKINNINVFARVVPNQKFLIVKALKDNEQVVAMTGDGVNDAPALKSANIGIAMGKRGTDVAREASSIILLDDDFSTIVDGVRLGRRIYDNLRKSMSYLFAVHIPIIGLALIPILLGWPLMFLPAHVVFLEFIIDPTCTLAFESQGEDQDIMKRKPHPINEPIFTNKILLKSFLQGLGILLIGLYIYNYGLNHGNEDIARTMAFLTVVMGNILLILTNISWDRSIVYYLFKKLNLTLTIILVLAFSLLALIITLPTLRTLFAFQQLNTNNLMPIVLALSGLFIWLEILRLIYFRSKSKLDLLRNNFS
ncbi:MAG: hypothetical protein ACD_58C00305G0003 [uncultured bacterium]|nr:MAG: hypothetical protein ACD_58C00305G0003 [uncultured bacterium]